MLYLTLIGTVSGLNLIMSLYACTRVWSLMKLTKRVQYQDVADLESDVSALKAQLRKLNGRISGLETPKYDSLLEARQIAQNYQNNLTNPNITNITPPKQRSG